MTQPNGGSMAALMATSYEFLDTWVKYAEMSGASTPELMAHMFIAMEEQPNKVAMLTALTATAIQRLAQQGG